MLEIADLHSHYGEAHIPRGVSLAVARGKVVALLGRNGMGKTTLIRSVMGLASPTVRQGTIRFDGQTLRGLAPHAIARRRVGLVPQGRRLFPSLTVQEHLAMTARRGGRWTEARVFELFPRLAERRAHRGHQLSGGERQMLAIGRALMLDPEMLLMDEPTEGLAPVMVQHVEAIVGRLRDDGLGILLVEQNLFSALAVADSVAIMETGEIVYRGEAEALRAAPETMQRFLGVG
jgi:branched-chain amino acid transport system ATP-binding protein